jgi:glutamine synthetase type III
MGKRGSAAAACSCAGGRLEAGERPGGSASCCSVAATGGWDAAPLPCAILAAAYGGENSVPCVFIVWKGHMVSLKLASLFEQVQDSGKIH